MLEAALCSPSEDNSFGPYAGACRGGFDFTLLFEEGILTIPLQCVILLAIPFRIAWLIKRSNRVRAFSLLLWLKVVQFLLPSASAFSSCLFNCMTNARFHR